MRWATIVTIVGLFLALPQARAGPDEKLVKAILAEWAARKTRVKTVSCTAKVESLFAKGCLSKELDDKSAPVYPPNDQRFSDQSCSWAIDFAEQRVRKEYDLVRPWIYGEKKDKCELAMEHSLHLFNDGKYRHYHNRDKYSAESKKSEQLTHDVTLHEGRSSDFLLLWDDLPLVWLGGGVTGQYPLPAKLRYSDEPTRFTFRGEALWNGKKCAVLTVPEQRSPTAVREFCVDLSKPYSIYRCCARDGDVVYWQDEVEYREEHGETVPSGWKRLEYGDGELISSASYSVEKIEVNVVLPRVLFEQPLEPGMLVFHSEKNGFFSVDSKGDLEPLGSASKRNLALPIAIAVLGLMALGLGWWFIRRRARRSPN